MQELAEVRAALAASAGHDGGVVLMADLARQLELHIARLQAPALG